MDGSKEPSVREDEMPSNATAGKADSVNNETQSRCRNMGKRKLDFMWAIALVVVLGATSSTLLGNDAPLMEAHQAGLFGQ